MNKTAMQELLDELKEYQLEFNIPIEVIDMCESQINVEKEQIINFCWECLRGDNIHTITSNKELLEYINNKYNKTYNQNK
jgi:hypothetical protein